MVVAGIDILGIGEIGHIDGADFCARRVKMEHIVIVLQVVFLKVLLFEQIRDNGNRIMFTIYGNWKYGCWRLQSF